MKSLKNFLNKLRQKADPNEIVHYYGHGANMHEHQEYLNEASNDVHNQIKYACPMKCEGDRTYDHPGNCPVCNMKLVPVNV